MTSRITVRRIAMIVALTLVWCGLWRTISFANVATGLAISTAIIATGVGSTDQSGLRLLPTLRLFWLVFVDLLSSTVEMAVEIITPTDYTEEGIVGVDLPEEHRHHLLFLTIAITLTPGTAVVDVDERGGTVYLHLLHIERRDATVAHVRELARVAAQAWPTPAVGATT